MKIKLTAIFALLALGSTAQEPLTPGKTSFEKNYVKNDSYQMTWFGLRDTTKIEIGEVTTEMVKSRKHLTIITSVKMKSNPAPWVDTTIADIATLKPVRHTSTNIQRDIALNFGNPVTGHYYDKMKKQNTVVNVSASQPYFDSNLYPHLLRWLPLSEGYKRDISIFDYNPSKKIGVIRASVTGVKSGTYMSRNSGSKEVWIVTVSDEIGTGNNDFSSYFIDKADRTLWKQEINAGGRKMVMLRKE